MPGRRRAGARRGDRRFALGVQDRRRTTAARRARRRCATWRSTTTKSTSPPPTRTSIALERANRARSPGTIRWPTPKLGYTYSSGPIVVKGLVVAGITGCQRYKNDVCFISAHDAQTGKELWRTSTIARPGEPGGDTLGRSAADVPRRRRCVDAGSYDPGDQPDLLGHRAGEALDPFRSRHRRRRALHQLHARDRSGDRQDRLVLPAHSRRNARHRRDRSSASSSTSTAGRRCSPWASSAILWELDRKSGAFVHARDLRYQNVLDVDPRTGKATYRPNMIPTGRRGAGVLPELLRLQEPARDGLPPGHAGLLHPAEPHLREGDVHAKSSASKAAAEPAAGGAPT